MTYQEISNLPRSRVALLNVYSYLILYPSNYVQRVEIKQLSTVYNVSVHFVHNRTGKEFIHGFSFYRLAEVDEVKQFIELLSTYIGGFEVSGDPII